MCNWKGPLDLTRMSLDCGSRSSRREPTQTRGEHSNSTQKVPDSELNPSSCVVKPLHHCVARVMSRCRKMKMEAMGVMEDQRLQCLRLHRELSPPLHPDQAVLHSMGGTMFRSDGAGLCVYCVWCLVLKHSQSWQTLFPRGETQGALACAWSKAARSDARCIVGR